MGQLILTPHFNQIGNCDFPYKEYQVRVNVWCRSVVALWHYRELETYIHYSCPACQVTLLLCLVSVQILSNGVWQLQLQGTLLLILLLMAASPIT